MRVVQVDTGSATRRRTRAVGRAEPDISAPKVTPLLQPPRDDLHTFTVLLLLLCVCVCVCVCHRVDVGYRVWRVRCGLLL